MTWQDYFDACKDNDIWKAFEALAGVGVLPVVNGEDDKGKLKRPMGDAWQKLTTEQWSEKLTICLREGVPVGIGAKPIGHLVIDVDPKDKNSDNLPDAWREMSQAIFGADDPPKTMIVRTENGAHVWFVVDDEFRSAWGETGKRKIKLPSGGAIEIFVGVPVGGYQLACAPSEGKSIAIAKPPIKLPKKAAGAILDLIKPKIVETQAPSRVLGQDERDLEWVKFVADQGYLDSEVHEYDAWLRVGMALYERFGETGAELWESWSNRSGKHVTNECYAKVQSFKRAGGNVVKFGSLIAIVERNGGPSPNERPKPTMPPSQPVEITHDVHAADVDTIRALMKERQWLWGNSEENTGWFVQRGLHLLEGKEGTGKTRWLLDLARRWSLDLRWPDGSPIGMETDSKMLFVASDSHFDQIAMTSDAFGIPSKNIIFTGPQGDPYAYTSLDDPTTIKLIRHWCTKYKVGMVVIDTLMAASTRPLVDPQEVAQLAQPLRDLARELNLVVVLVGHLNSQGETWGRAMGRQCDNVIRMEADERDEQLISIRSVKARWNRFALPTLHGRQGETGWEFDMPNAEDGNVRFSNKKERTKAHALAYIRKYPNCTKGMIVGDCVESGYTKSTAYDVIEEMTTDETITFFEETTFSGGKLARYRVNS
jgi:hypothetical protein